MTIHDKTIPLPFIRDPRRIACGGIVTRYDLPPTGSRRWTMAYKAMVADAVRTGMISQAEANARYATSERELTRWIGLLDQGIRAFRADNFEHDALPENSDDVPALQDGPFAIDFTTKLVRVDGHIVAFQPTEFRVLSMLIHRAPATVERADIYAMLYASKQHQPAPKILDVLICKIRRRLNCNAAIETVWGRGWQWKGFR